MKIVRLYHRASKFCSHFALLAFAVFAAWFLSNSSAYAETEYTGEVGIAMLTVQPGKLRISIDSAVGQQSCATAGNQAANHFLIKRDYTPNTEFELYTSMAVSAFHAGKKIQIQSIGCVDDMTAVYGLYVYN